MYHGKGGRVDGSYGEDKNGCENAGVLGQPFVADLCLRLEPIVQNQTWNALEMSLIVGYHH